MTHLEPMVPSPFKWVVHYDAGRYDELRSERYLVTIEPRPPHCDRGRYLVKIHRADTHLDAQDGWPRYYFSLDAARSEVEAFLKCRGLDK